MSRSRRRPTLGSVARAAAKARIPVQAYRIEPDGTIVVVVGRAEINHTPGQDIDRELAEFEARNGAA